MGIFVRGFSCMAALAAAVLAVGLWPASASAQSASAPSTAAFYKSQPLRILVGYGPGTGYDVYARVLGRHLARFVPGEPTVVIQNMPGAASLNMVNYLYNVAPRDGASIGVPARGLFIEPLFGDKNARFDARRFTWIGSMSRDTALCFSWHTSGVETLADTQKKEVLVGATGAVSSSNIFPQIMNAEIGTRFKPVLGYPNSGAIGLAMERGELAGYCSFTWASLKAAHKDWLDKKWVILLAQLSLAKNPELPDVPLAMDYAKTEAARQMFGLVFSDQEMGRPVVAPPEVPADRTAALRKAFMATMKDPAFLADAKKTGVEIDPIDGPAIEKILAKLYATPPGIIAKVKAIRGG